MQTLDRRMPLNVIPFNSPHAVSLIIAINIIVAVGGSVIEILPSKDSDSPAFTCPFLFKVPGGGDPLQTLGRLRDFWCESGRMAPGYNMVQNIPDKFTPHSSIGCTNVTDRRTTYGHCEAERSVVTFSQ